MQWFTQRKKLNEKYKNWIKKNKIADTSFNVISFLAGHNLLDEKKVENFLGGTDYPEKKFVKTVCSKCKSKNPEDCYIKQRQDGEYDCCNKNIKNKEEK